MGRLEGKVALVVREGPASGDVGPPGDDPTAA
jgi:hypothetical protein